MTNLEIYKTLMKELKEEPFVFTSKLWAIQPITCTMKFRNRDGKFYATVTMPAQPSERETCTREFRAWLYKKLKPYGWIPYITSGGMGEWTYRLDGGIEFDFGP